MNGYAKLFGDILDSSIWHEANETKLVWITMLAMKDDQGLVSSSIPGLAKRAGVTLGECQAALNVLLAPDPYSRTKAHEGRRIEPKPQGWNVLNHFLYQDRMGEADRREYNRIKQAEKRARDKAKEPIVNDMSPNVTECHGNGVHTDTKASSHSSSNPPKQVASDPKPEPAQESDLNFELVSDKPDWAKENHS